VTKKIKYKINIGCGKSPTYGWMNFDNSPAIMLANSPLKYFFAKTLNFLNQEQIENINWNKNNKILFADAKKKLPLPNVSAECIYTSHMIEHLSRDDVVFFLNEVIRVLELGGILRVVVPDLKHALNSYIKNQDADIFMEKIYVTPPPINSIKQKISLFFNGYRHHQWMYDEKSLTKLIKTVGFRKVFICKAGETNIADPGNLNLYERSEDSIYIEALK
jgi:predicted SAM-dependent methyltransferase